MRQSLAVCLRGRNCRGIREAKEREQKMALARAKWIKLVDSRRRGGPGRACVLWWRWRGNSAARGTGSSLARAVRREESPIHLAGRRAVGEGGIVQWERKKVERKKREGGPKGKWNGMRGRGGQRSGLADHCTVQHFPVACCPYGSSARPTGPHTDGTK